MDERYQITTQTSTLSFGTQYEATDQLISRKVQIHRFDTPPSGAPKKWKDIFDERSRMLAALSHTGLAIIYDRGIDEEGPFLIRQLINEPSLASRIEQGPLSEYEARELAEQLLDIHATALPSESVHGHLDLGQICFTSRPSGEKRYYVTDYGYADLRNKINGAQTYFGLPCLISLEQASGQKPSESSQIFSLGQLIYLSLAGGHPYADKPAEEIAELHKSSPLPPISQYQPALPQPFVDWLSRMTQPDPTQRFSSFAGALAELPSTDQAPTRPAPTASQPQTVVPAASLSQTQQVTAQTNAAAAFAAEQEALKNAKKEQLQSSVSQLKQTPIMIGGGVLVLLIIISLFVFTGDDDADSNSADSTTHYSSTSSDSSSQQDDNDSIIPTDGLVVSLNFDDSLRCYVTDSLLAESLASDPIYTQGIHGKGLLLDENHYFRFPINKEVISDSAPYFTISFWVKTTASNSHSPSVTSYQPWDSKDSHKVGEKGSEQWLWSPNANSKKSALNKDDWSMLTYVFSRDKKRVTIYNNGELLGNSTTEGVTDIAKEEYLYIGCDNQQKSNFSSAVTMDQLLVWNRRLGSSEIREMHQHGITQ